MIGTILMALVAGAIVGPLARLVLPGRQDMGVLLTVVLGAIESLIGAFIYYKATGVDDTWGIDWISGLIGVVVAAALIVGYGMVTGNRQTRCPVLERRVSGTPTMNTSRTDPPHPPLQPHQVGD